jgi:ABC-2 type transport system permease protein
MTATTMLRAGSTGTAQQRLPGLWRTGLARGWLELKGFFRDAQTVVFIFALPAVFLVLLGSIFGHQATAAGVSVGQLFTAGMIAGGIGSTTFQYLGISIAGERDRGMLKRLLGTPMPPAAYFIGKIIQVFACAVLETVGLITVGVAFYHLHLPTSAMKWLTFGWVFLLGTICCALLGIAISSLPRKTGSAMPVITLPFLVLQFISGVYIPFHSVPPWLQHVAALFPLKWLSQGLRAVFLPARAAVLEPAHSFELGRVALVLAAWAIGGLVLCLTTFRWRSSQDG